MQVRLSHVILTLALAILVSARVEAAVTTIPTGLNPGDTYRLMFVTSTRIQASSTDIAYYNSFVQTSANAADIGIGSTIFGTDVSWFAFASTESTNVLANIGTINGPIYTVGDALVANSQSDLFDGSISNGIAIDENGTLVTSKPNVWTGTKPDGTTALNQWLGGPSSGIGLAGHLSSLWLFERGLNPSSTATVYGISEPMTVPFETISIDIKPQSCPNPTQHQEQRSPSSSNSRDG